MSEQSVPDTERFARQLKKGVLEMVVLRLLAEQPSHGYELIQRLRRGSGGMLDLKEGTLYPILYRLEDDGYITSAWQNTESGKQRPAPRKVYTLSLIHIFRMVGSGSAAYGQGWEMDAIAACVVGGISFTCGIGKISGVVVGVFIFTALTYSLTTLGIDCLLYTL